MADALAGFTPRFAALLRSAGVNLGSSPRGNTQTTGSGTGSAGNGWGTFTAADLAEQRSAAAARQVAPASIAAQTINLDVTPRPFGSGYTQDELQYQRDQVQKLYQQYVTAAEQEKQRGANPPGHHIPWYDRVLSVISRPGQAVEGFLYGDLGKYASDDTPSEGGGLSGRLHAAASGFTGHSHYSTTQMLRNLGVQNRAVLFAGGLTGDIALDPTSYVGVGIAKNAITAPEKAAETLSVAQHIAGSGAAGTKLASKLGTDIAAGSRVVKGREAAQVARDASTPINVAANQAGLRAAQSARSVLATDLTTVGMSQAKADRMASRWLNPTYAGTPKMVAESTPWLTKIMGDPNTLKTSVGTTTTEVAAAEEAKTAEQLTALLHANLQQAVQRSVKLTVGGVPILKAPVPMAAQRVLQNAARTNMVSKSLGVFDKVFHTGTRYDNALTVVKAREAGRAQRRIESARQLVTQAFTGTTKDARRAYMEALATSPRAALAKGIMTNAAGDDVADTAQQLLGDLAAYVDFKGDGSKLLGIDDLNRYLPGPKGPLSKGNYYKFDKRTMIGASGNKIRVQDFNDLIKANADYLRHVDPAKFLYALHLAVEKGVARDQLGRAVTVFGVPKNAQVLLRDAATGRMMQNVPSQTARQLMDKHGYEPIHTGGHEQEVSGFYGKHLDGLIFDPEAKKGILRVLQIADHEEKRAEVTRMFDAVQNNLKKVLTLPSPSFHIRNSFGDFMTGTADGVFGPRGMRSYEQAAKTMTGLRRINKPGSDLNSALLQGVDPLTGDAPNPVEALSSLIGTPKEAGAGKRIMKAPRNWPDAPGGYLTDGQLWAAYNHAGLNQGYVLGDLGLESAPHASPRTFQAVHGAMDKLMGLSAARENFFRLGHFIDRLKRSKAPTFEKAAEEAAYYVRKYHFDYTDVTPIEQSLFARAIPFYKWQRFATPLMLQLFFAKPGVISNWNKVGLSLAESGGYEIDPNMLPSADQVLPEYFLDAAMLPLYKNSAGNNVYFNMGLPQSGIGTQTLGLGGSSPSGVARGAFTNLMSSVSPIVATPFELATQRRIFGGGQIPTGPAPQYLFSRLGPSAGLVQNAQKPDANTRLVSLLTGMGLSENTPGRQSAYLNDLLAQIRANRRKAGVTNVKPPKPHFGSGGGR